MAQELRRLAELIGGTATITDPSETTRCAECGRRVPWDQALVLVDNERGTCDPLCTGCVAKRRLWALRG